MGERFTRLLMVVALGLWIAAPLQAQTWDETLNGGGDAGDFPAGGFQGDPDGVFYDAITGNNSDGIDAYLIQVTDPSNFYIEDLGGADTKAFLWEMDATGFLSNDDNAGPNAVGFSFGFGDANTHLGSLIGPVGTVSEGDMYILSVGGFGDTAAGDGGGTVFLGDGGDFTAATGPTGENFVGWNAAGAGSYSIQLNGCRMVGPEGGSDVWDEFANGGGDAGDFPAGDFQSSPDATCYTFITGDNADGVDSYGIEVTDAANFYIEDLGGNDTKAFLWEMDTSGFLSNDDNAGPNAAGFSFGFGDANTHLGNLNGPVGTVSNGDMYVLSVGSFLDTAAGDLGGTVFIDDLGDFEAANGPTGENFVGWNVSGTAGSYFLSLNGCKLLTTGSKGCDFEIGDVNQDGLISLLDVNPFVAILIGGGFQCEADINEDGSVTLTDVDPFVALLTGG